MCRFHSAVCHSNLAKFHLILSWIRYYRSSIMTDSFMFTLNGRGKLSYVLWFIIHQVGQSCFLISVMFI